MRHTTAAPLRRADRTLAGATGALLPPRLRAAAAHFGARLRAVRSGPLGRELRGDDLVHDRNVRLDAEDVVGQLDGAGVGAVAVFIVMRAITPSPPTSLRCGRTRCRPPGRGPRPG